MKHAIWILLLVFSACRSTYVVDEIGESQQKFDLNYTKQDTLIESEIKPYRTELNKSMNSVIAQAEKTLTKAQPESTLGNLLADGTLIMAEKYTNSSIDIGIVNYGGIRVPSINKGAVTLGNVYELMPFDNYLVVLNIKGSVLIDVCNVIAVKKGWPVSGLTMAIKDGKAENIKIKNEAIDKDKEYSVAISDYLANGGDNLSMLVNIKQQNTNILLRDAWIEYFKLLNSEGKFLNANLENRISNE